MAAVHRTILVLDVAGFGDLQRTNLNQIAVRDSLYRILPRAFEQSGLSWQECDHEDRGDGMLVIVPPEVPKSAFVESLPDHLAAALRAHNDTCDPEERIRLRVALHAGEINYDDHGVVGRSVNLAFRLLEAPVLKTALAESSGCLALITSSWFFDEVVFHSRSPDRGRYYQVSVTVKETETTAWILLPDAEHAGNGARQSGGGRPVPRQLPAGTRRFVGRDRELSQLMALLDGVAAQHAVAVAAIDGSAGVGKTALATHWAHQVKSRFPDGQLHVDLRGYDSREPMAAGQVLHGFLQALGVDTTAIPVGVDAKASLYRSLLSDRRMLIVLDNARSSDQVRPLLPAAEHCFVLVASRNRLNSLMVREGAFRITLDNLPVEDAMALLAERVGRERLDAEPDAAAELVDLCVRLPLALSIVAARASGWAVSPLSGLVRELRDERHRLDALDLGDEDLSIRAVFSWSTGVLSPDAARLFRLLGVHPGPDVDLFACEAVAGTASHTRELLNELTGGHLITEHVPGRFRFHDLLRAYAAEQAALPGYAAERAEAIQRFLDHYLHIALLADVRIQPGREGVMRVPDDPADDMPMLATYEAAIAWFSTECATLVALVQLADEENATTACRQLAWACTTFLRRTSRWHDRVAVHEAALAVTIRCCERKGEGLAHAHLGAALARLGRHTEALDHLNAAAGIFAELRDDINATTTFLAFSRLYEALGEHTVSLDYADRAWQLVRDSDSRLNKGDALTAMGRQLSCLGRNGEALRLCEQALDHYSAIGHVEGEADVLADIADIAQQMGDHETAVKRYRESMAIDRMLGDRFWEASVLERLGDAYLANGDQRSAEQSWQQSAKIFQELKHSQATEVQAKLAVVTEK